MDMFSDVPEKEEMDLDSDGAKEEEEMLRDLSHVSELLDRCKAAHRFGQLATAGGLASEAKVLLSELRLTSLPPLLAETPNCKCELKLAREIHESATMLAKDSEDLGAFDREFAELKPYYSVECESRIGRSWEMNGLFGFYLSRLLEKNMIDEFHAELKSLPATALSSPIIEDVIEMEKLLSGELKLECQTLSMEAREEIYGRREKTFDSQEEPQPKWEMHNGQCYLILRASKSQAHPHFA